MPKKNKRGVEAVAATIGAFILIFIGVALVFPLFPQIIEGADDSIKDEICKINIDLRRHELAVTINLGFEARLATLRAPLKGCVTVDKKTLPKKGESEELVKKSIADLMKDCWQRYDEGRAGDIFKEGSPWTNNCQTCYVFKVKKDAKIEKGKITSEEFTQYLATTPYKARDTTNGCFTFGKDRGGFCANTQEECTRYIKTDLKIEFDEKNSVCKKQANKGEGCCYSNIDCWNNGGECSKGYLGQDYTVYPNWKCPRDETCYIKKENDLSYYTYIQRGSGPGDVRILTDIEPNEIYAISFGAPTKECTNDAICNTLSTGGGLILAGSVAVFAAKGVVAACATGVLCIPAIIVGGTATVGAYAIGSLIGEGTAKVTYIPIRDLWSQRPTSTIYLSTVSQIQDQKVTGQQGELCSIIPE